MKKKRSMRHRFAWYQHKAVHTLVDAAIANPSLTAWQQVVATIDHVVQGTGAGQRVGERILATGLMFRLCLMAQARDIQSSSDDISIPTVADTLVPLEDSVLRMLVIRVARGVTISAPVLPEDIAGADSVYGIIRNDQRGLYKVLRDIKITIRPKQFILSERLNGANTYRTFRVGLFRYDRTFFLKLNQEVDFESSSTQAPKKGQIQIWWIANRIAPDFAQSGGVNLIQSRYTFVDLPR